MKTKLLIFKWVISILGILLGVLLIVDFFTDRPILLSNNLVLFFPLLLLIAIYRSLEKKQDSSIK